MSIKTKFTIKSSNDTDKRKKKSRNKVYFAKAVIKFGKGLVKLANKD